MPAASHSRRSAFRAEMDRPSRPIRARCGSGSQIITTCSAARPPAPGSITSCMRFSAWASASRAKLRPGSMIKSRSSSLAHHHAIRESGWKGRVIPCFRPDAVFQIASPGWPAELEALGREHGAPLVDYAEFLRALEDRRAFFKRMGATATDHAVLEPYTTWLPPNETEVLDQ